MLKDTLFKVTSLDHQEKVITATLEIDKNNEVFAGHFVLPDLGPIGERSPMP